VTIASGDERHSLERIATGVEKSLF
jgi:hypothetical protein